MSNYKQTTVAGESWTRAYSVNIQNPLDGQRYINFQEEKAFVTPDGDALTKRVGEVYEFLTPENITTTFNLLNPQTGEVVGTASYADAYAMLHSLYIHLALRRDQQLAQLELEEAERQARLEAERQAQLPEQEPTEPPLV